VAAIVPFVLGGISVGLAEEVANAGVPVTLVEPVARVAVGDEREALDLLQRSMATLSSSLDLSTWCNPTSSVGRHTKMLVLISNTFWRFAAH
jgi:hypothetical protein